MMRKKDPEEGFTIIELLVASTVFSVVLVVISVGLIQVTKLFYKGTTLTNTQEVARSIMDDISQAIQLSGDRVVTSIPGSSGSQGFCVGTRQYSYLTGVPLSNATPNNHVLVVVDPVNGCGGTTAQSMSSVSSASRELMGNNMRLGALSLQSVPGASGLYNVTVRVVHGDDSVLDPATKTQCAANLPSGTEFCAYSELTTTVQQRIQ